jgi:hypothetical protein
MSRDAGPPGYTVHAPTSKQGRRATLVAAPQLAISASPIVVDLLVIAADDAADV